MNRLRKGSIFMLSVSYKFIFNLSEDHLFTRIDAILYVIHKRLKAY